MFKSKKPEDIVMSHPSTGKTDADLGSEDSVRAYEADAAELEAAVAGTMAAGADADAVFGEISEGGPNYRAVGWKCESSPVLHVRPLQFFSDIP